MVRTRTVWVNSAATRRNGGGSWPTRPPGTSAATTTTAADIARGQRETKAARVADLVLAAVPDWDIGSSTVECMATGAAAIQICCEPLRTTAHTVRGRPSRRPTWPRLESWACSAFLRFDGRFYHRTAGSATIRRSMQGRQCGHP